MNAFGSYVNICIRCPNVDGEWPRDCDCTTVFITTVDPEFEVVRTCIIERCREIKCDCITWR